jgi:tetratricopeptide (TPR) repeat protein
MEHIYRLRSFWREPAKVCGDHCRCVIALTLCGALLWAVAGCHDARTILLLNGNERSEAGDDSSALACYTAAIRVDSTFADAYFNRGVIYLRRGELYLAFPELNSAIRYDPGRTDAYRARAAALKASLNRLSSPDSCLPNLSVQRTSRFATAVLLFRDLTTLNNLDPEDVAVLADRIECAWELGDRESMEQDLDCALGMAPDDVWLLNRRGRLRFELGMYREAVTDYTQALVQCDTCVYLMYNRALACIEQGELVQALADLDRVLTNDPEDGPAWYALGRCLVILERVSEGEACLEKATSLGVSDADLLLRRLRP